MNCSELSYYENIEKYLYNNYKISLDLIKKILEFLDNSDKLRIIKIIDNIDNSMIYKCDGCKNFCCNKCNTYSKNHCYFMMEMDDDNNNFWYDNEFYCKKCWLLFRKDYNYLL